MLLGLSANPLAESHTRLFFTAKMNGQPGVGMMPAEPQEDFPVEESIPEGAAPLESILCTEELRRRPWRPPDHEKENRALVALMGALADSPSTIFQTLAETI